MVTKRPQFWVQDPDDVICQGCFDCRLITLCWGKKWAHEAQDENEERRGHWWGNSINRTASVGYLELWTAHVSLNVSLWIVWLRAFVMANSRTEIVWNCYIASKLLLCLEQKYICLYRKFKGCFLWSSESHYFVLFRFISPVLLIATGTQQVLNKCLLNEWLN